MFASGAADPSPRRSPRRDTPAVLTVRVELAHTSPPLWRRLDLASDLYLDEVHDILQAVFGWDDSHLHKFGTGGGRFHGRGTGYFLAPFADEEGTPGIPERRVRLDEVLSSKGDELFYMYDFGDSWEHVLTLQDTRDLAEDTPRAVCTAGRRPSLVDDCGGVPGYEFWNAVNDPDHPHHDEAKADFREGYGQDEGYDPAGWAPVPFDRERVNELLTARFPRTGPSRDERDALGPVPEPKRPTPVDEVVYWSRGCPEHGAVRELVERARLEDGGGDPDPASVRTAVAPFTWLLDHLAGDGVRLTKAGYLPPASVEEAAEALSLGDSWVGQLNREDQTAPVLLLRESAQTLRLVRRYGGKLVLTPAGRGARSDPAALWRHVMERLPFAAESSLEGYADILFLLSLAAGETEPERHTARIMETTGGHPNGLSGSDVVGLVHRTRGVLRLMGAYPGRWGHGTATPTGAEIARAALRHWPRYR
ncbi:IS1096 element passenger TnpR family protein [Nocardiopsis synnemataformans]|uniref:plasmid pRiA4b ORF-3 family protein n=1 Tax=Nocardiopsis synnemataformans TaxID=61305 RepID=UPI003EBA0CD8